MARRRNPSTSKNLANRPRSANAAQQLLQYIRRQGLQAGDQLPSQSQLRGDLGFSNDSLSAAMGTLVSSGVLIRRPGLGTIVVDPSKTVSGIWRVGLAVLPAVRGQAYYGQLLLALQVHLAALGATTTYIPDHEINHGAAKLSDFGLLLDDLEACRLHGVLVMSGLDTKEIKHWNNRGVPMMHVGPWEGAPSGVVIDQGPLIERAVALMFERGIHEVGVVSIGGPTPGHRRFWDRYRHLMEVSGIEVDEQRHSYAGGEGSIGGARVARRLLALPPEERPPGLIVIDDRMAVGLTAVLAEHPEYRPLIVVQTNIQAPLLFALPVIHVELDVDDLAKAAATDLLERLVQPETPPKLHWIAPRLHGPAESRFAPSIDAAAIASG
jgi:DNA-binding LacI/PurR family transcriptional regulator